LVTFPPLLRLQLNAAAPLVEAAGFGLDKKHAASLAGRSPARQPHNIRDLPKPIRYASRIGVILALNEYAQSCDTSCGGDSMGVIFDLL
jgi:hypothetical protein